MIHYKIEKFRNGVTLITAPMKETQAVSLLIAVSAGSRYEEASQSGISHFLEHLFFKGTKRRPSKLLIAKALDSLGANYNAMTSEEATAFYIQAAADKFPEILDILSDMLLNPLIPEKEVELEKGVIAEEIKMYKDDPMLHVQDLAKELTFGDTPLGRNIAGTLETIDQINKKTIEDYRKKFYRPASMIVAISGNPKKFNWSGQIHSIFGKLKAGPSPRFQAYQDDRTESKVLVSHRKTDQAHLVLNFKTFAKDDPRRFPLLVLNKILGGYMSSRLFLKIREERGLAYYVRSGLDSFHDTGTIQASAGLKTQSLPEAVKIIFKELQNFRENKIRSEEISRAKENFRGELSLELEDSFKVALFLADDYLYFGRIFQPEELIKKVFEVDKKSIQNLGRDIFTPQNIALTVLGPYDKDKTEDKLKALIEKNF